ncbi:MAG TPA: MBL fold metallo-hydrolase [Candidatus Acidoferrales bacterium]|nr:MBL fold metallo-hydrolase [Candidatus Acidoferrales bacterium]
MNPSTAQIRFWGVRGSTPTVDQATWRYGGNTPCLELITPGGARFILDCGTGVRALGNHLAGVNGAPTNTVTPLHAHIFLTHYHWDHIQGIPFFSPLYSPFNKFHFYSYRSKFLGRDSLKQVFETQMAYPYFPVDVSAMTAEREFTEISGGDSLQIEDAKITMFWLNHPQGCLGFRFETSAGTIAYSTDNEPGNPELDANLLQLAHDADIFINDAQYTPEQLAGPRRGWGHSSWLAGAQVAREAGARNLVLFHHDPDHSDKDVDGLLRHARQHFENVYAATEGMAMGFGAKDAAVILPEGRSGHHRDGNLRAVVTGYTSDGRAFQEQTVIRDLTLQGALLYLAHSPRLQSELQVEMGDPGKESPAEHPMHLRGYVVKLEPGPRADQTAVGVVFTE